MLSSFQKRFWKNIKTLRLKRYLLLWIETFFERIKKFLKFTKWMSRLVAEKNMSTEHDSKQPMQMVEINLKMILCSKFSTHKLSS